METIGAVKSQTKRAWIYAKKPAGPLYNYRNWLGYFLLLFLFSGPFIKIGDNPFLMFNILERKFSIFGQLFYPQDLHIFLFVMLISLVCIVLFTVVYGRVWCGWACPQTIFMELIFRKVEYWIEGDRNQQRKLNEGPDTTEKQQKKILKHGIFLLISFFIANTFLAYIIGADALITLITDPFDAHITGLATLSVFTLVFYGVFAHVREIVCTTICPYGRLQSVLLDNQTVTVAYDYRRGEPRGKVSVASNLGDCVDCNLCVQVCPTGIDIRNGLQMECVSCTACIDACDAVMHKLTKAPKLIGFYTMGELEGEKRKKNNLRAIGYSCILVLLIASFGFLIFNRSTVGGTVLRAKGSTYQLRDDHTISNLYTMELRNKTSKEFDFDVTCSDPSLKVQLVNPIKHLQAEGTATISFFLIVDNNQVTAYKKDVKIYINAKGQRLETFKTTFIAPLGMD